MTSDGIVSGGWEEGEITLIGAGIQVAMVLGRGLEDRPDNEE